MTGNEIGDEGAKSLCETLQVNSTLTSLELECEEDEKKKKRGRKEKEMMLWLNDRQLDWR